MADVPIGTVRNINETYLLCLRSSHNAKIRNSVMDLKWRKQVHPDGPELWDRVLRSEFPCKAGFILRLFQIWGIEPPDLRRLSYSRAQFLKEVVALHPALRALPVHKHEEAFMLDGAACAFHWIKSGDLRLEGFRIEHEDPALIAETLRSLDLGSHQNINTALGLKRALGLVPA